jgi:tetratricopeptide (TPR) repeat protein
VVYKVRTTQNFTGQDYKGIENLQKKVASFSKQKTARQSTALRFKIYQSISRILLQKQDFVSLEKYLIQTFEEFSKANLFGRNNHETKLQMLTYLTNSLAKNGKHDESLKMAHSLRSAMNEYGGHLHDKYLFFYYNALVVNYSQKDIRKGIEILEEAKENAVIQKLPFFIVFIYANLSVLNFDDGNYKQAIKNLVKLTMESGFENLDRSLRFKIAVAELIIRYEIGDFDFL